MTSRLKKKYSSRDNKGIIWGVLLENKLFEGLNDSQSILNEFEQQIRTIGETIQQKDSIVSLNKKTINHMVSYIKYMKTQQQQQQTSQQSLPNTSSAHTIEDIMKERQQHFKKTLNAKQEEFKRTIQGHIPKAIDFSDKAVQPMDGDMDRKLSELMEKRGVELNYLPKKKEELKKATNWIQNGGTFQPTTTTTSNEQSIQLQIGEKVELNELNDFQPIPIYKEQDNTSFRKKQSSLLSTSKQKKVRFSDTDTTTNTEIKTITNDFLQMLKTKREPSPTQPSPTQSTQPHTDENLSNQVNDMNTLLKTVLEKINTMEEKWNELKKEKREIINKREISTQTTPNDKKKFKDAETNTNDIEEKIISPSQKNKKVKKNQQIQKN